MKIIRFSAGKPPAWSLLKLSSVAVAFIAFVGASEIKGCTKVTDPATAKDSASKDASASNTTLESPEIKDYCRAGYSKKIDQEKCSTYCDDLCTVESKACGGSPTWIQACEIGQRVFLTSKACSSNDLSEGCDKNTAFKDRPDLSKACRFGAKAESLRTETLNLGESNDRENGN